MTGQGLESKVDMDVWLGIQRWGIPRGDPEAGTGSGESLGGSCGPVVKNLPCNAGDIGSIPG